MYKYRLGLELGLVALLPGWQCVHDKASHLDLKIQQTSMNQKIRVLTGSDVAQLR